MELSPKGDTVVFLFKDLLASPEDASFPDGIWVWRLVISIFMPAVELLYGCIYMLLVFHHVIVCGVGQNFVGVCMLYAVLGLYGMKDWLKVK